MPETAKRLAPSQETLRELYLKSGNQCAFPGCGALLMDDDGTFIGQLCHIEAAEPGGERFNPLQTNEERRCAANLLLMCYPHHRVTNDVSRFGVNELRAMKERHEARFTNPDRSLLERVTRAKWATLVGAGFVAGAGLSDIVRNAKSLLAKPRTQEPNTDAEVARIDLVKRLRLAPVGVIRYYSRDPLHAAVGDNIMELFQSAGWSLQQINRLHLAAETQSLSAIDHGMFLAFEVAKESQVSNSRQAILGVFEALGFTVPDGEGPAERSGAEYKLQFFLVFGSRER